MVTSCLRALASRARPYLPALLACAVLGGISIHVVLEAAGEPVVPLDDAFIHLQFARRLAGGSFFSYLPGEGYSSGATSLLWPLLLAPFHLLRLRGLSLVYAAWALGTLSYAAVVVETTRLARRLSGPAAAVGAGVMSAAFAAFAWYAWSGMETVLAAWALLRAARVSAEWCEAGDERAPKGARARVWGIGLMAPLVRPEGIIGSLIAAAALAVRPRGGRRVWALAPLAGALVTPLINRILLGRTTSATIMSKWLFASPYHRGEALWGAILHNLTTITGELMDGGGVVSLYVPTGSRIPIIAGVAALVLASFRRPLRARALFTLAVALGGLIPCTYGVMLWHRGRYFWPFAGAWFVGIACLAQQIGDLFRRTSAARAAIPVLIPGIAAGAMATKIPGAVRDLAQSARAVDRQHVVMARWAAESLPADARIGVNDTGALTYLGGHPTFDVVGLTTEGEGRYWTAGPGSRFEHYERMPRERLPTHFIVYPMWMDCPPVIGDRLHEETVMDQTILGGFTMGAYKARWDLLGSGALPARVAPLGRLADELDVADLESESDHAYDLTGATMKDDQAVVLDVPWSAGRRIADGARTHRFRDRFVMRGREGVAGQLVLRVSSDAPAEISVRLGTAREPVRIPLPGGTWIEPVVEIAAADDRALLDVEVVSVPPRATGRAPASFTSFHYWLYLDG